MTPVRRVSAASHPRARLSSCGDRPRLGIQNACAPAAIAHGGSCAVTGRVVPPPTARCRRPPPLPPRARRRRPSRPKKAGHGAESRPSHAVRRPLATTAQGAGEAVPIGIATFVIPANRPPPEFLFFCESPVPGSMMYAACGYGVAWARSHSRHTRVATRPDTRACNNLQTAPQTAAHGSRRSMCTWH